MIKIGFSIAIIGTLLVAIPHQISVVVGFIIIGLGCAPIYPSIIHSTPKHFGEENSGAIIGVQMAAAYVGSMLMPPLFGVIADYTDLRVMPIFLGFFFILMITMLQKTEKACNVTR